MRVYRHLLSNDIHGLYMVEYLLSNLNIQVKLMLKDG